MNPWLSRAAEFAPWSGASTRQAVKSLVVRWDLRLCSLVGWCHGLHSVMLKAWLGSAIAPQWVVLHAVLCDHIMPLAGLHVQAELQAVLCNEAGPQAVPEGWEGF